MANWWKASDRVRYNIDAAVRVIAESYIDSGTKWRVRAYFNDASFYTHAQGLSTEAEATVLIAELLDLMNS